MDINPASFCLCCSLNDVYNSSWGSELRQEQWGYLIVTKTWKREREREKMVRENKSNMVDQKKKKKSRVCLLVRYHHFVPDFIPFVRSRSTQFPTVRTSLANLLSVYFIFINDNCFLPLCYVISSGVKEL